MYIYICSSYAPLYSHHGWFYTSIVVSEPFYFCTNHNWHGTHSSIYRIWWQKLRVKNFHLSNQIITIEVALHPNDFCENSKLIIYFVPSSDQCPLVRNLHVPFFEGLRSSRARSLKVPNFRAPAERWFGSPSGLPSDLAGDLGENSRISLGWFLRVISVPGYPQSSIFWMGFSIINQAFYGLK